MVSSTKPQILWLGTMGKAPNNRLLYVPEKKQWIVKLWAWKKSQVLILSVLVNHSDPYPDSF